MRLILCMMLALAASPALAASATGLPDTITTKAVADSIAAPDQPATHKVTVAEVYALVNAITALDARPSVDNHGHSTTTPTNFEFSGETEWTLARAEKIGVDVINSYNDALAKERARLKGKPVPVEMISGMLEAPAFAELPHIKRRDLCLDATPQACSVVPPVRNQIPLSTLSGLLPMVDP